MNTPVVTAHRVREDGRLQSLPKHFGQHMVTFEGMVYRWTRRLAPSYRGAYWHYYDLSNGGFYMAPDLEPLQLVVANGFNDTMTADAAGITACLFAYSHLSFAFENDDLFSRHYHWLRDFALAHAESSKIIQATD